MKYLSYIFISLTFLGLYSCGKSFFYSESVTIPDGIWKYENIPSFTVEIDDVSKPYNLVLELAHSSAYPYQNIYIKFHVTNPENKTTDSQVSLELSDKTGRWYGECGGEMCTIQSLLQKSVKFPVAGSYTFAVEQYLRQESIEGIESIGIMLEQLEK